MAQPPVSVIVIVRNGERFLAQALQSIADQTYAPAEIVVIDGQSTDDTGAIAQSFGNVRVVTQTTPGIAAAYNQGIETATHDYLAFLSYDDMWTPNKLQLQMDYLLAHPECRFVIAKLELFLETGADYPPGFRRHLLESSQVGFIMETLLARRRAFTDNGLFDNTIAIGNDTDWYARAIDNKLPMAVLPDVLLRKRVHNENTSLAQVQFVSKESLEIIRRSILRKRLQTHAPVSPGKLD